MNRFLGRRNQVYPSLWCGHAAVEKHFAYMEAWQWETALYAVLEDRLPLLRVLASVPGLLITEYKHLPTLAEELQRQEVHGFFPDPWRALAGWLIDCHALCSRLPSEEILQNFLWSAETGHVIGLDLEEFQEDTIPLCGAKLIARLLSEPPADTAVKFAVATMLAQIFSTSDQAIQGARSQLCQKKKMSPFSGVVLAGGHSSRMGQDKSALLLRGQTLLEWQIKKLRDIGAQDILISGVNAPVGTRQVMDVYPNRGALGGIHACLQAAKNDRCLVLGVDVPLVSFAALEHLRRAHQQGVTVLSCNGRQEPLIGMYDSTLANTVENLIFTGSVPVQALKSRTSWTSFEYKGPTEFLHHCNTPQDFALIAAVESSYFDAGLSLNGRAL